MNKTTKYLPVHPAMLKFLPEGTTVIHNGDTSRCGWKGFIKYQNEKGVYVRYVSRNLQWATDTEPQWYSSGWFSENFYVIASDILPLKGFNGRKYFEKYKEFCKTLHDLQNVQPKHKELKEKVDKLSSIGLDSSVLIEVDANSSGGVLSALISHLSKNKIDLSKQHLKEVLASQCHTDKETDYLDSVGEYHVVNYKNMKHHGSHKTERIANMKAVELATKYSGEFIVTKTVSKTEIVCNTKINRL